MSKRLSTAKLVCLVMACLVVVPVSLPACESTTKPPTPGIRELIHVYSEVYSVSEQGPVYLYVWFRRFPGSGPRRRTLDQVTFDFRGHPVYFDADGQRVQFIVNNLVSSARFEPSDDPQVFGFSARNFRSRGTVICKLDLDRGPDLDQNPFTKDYLEGTLTFHFSGGLEIVATFDRQGSFGDRTAKA